MASLKSFITSSLLRKLDCVKNEELFAPIKDELIKLGILGVELSGNSNFDYSKFAHYLRNNCPKEIQDKLYYFYSIAHPSLRDKIVEQLQLLGIETTESEDVYCLASRLIFSDITLKHCQKINSFRVAQEEHSYMYFRPTKLKETQPLNDFQIKEMKHLLSKHFEYTTSKRFVEIHTHEIGSFVYYCIFHSYESKQELVINKNNEEEILHYNPQLMDILRLDPQTGELAIYVRYSNKSLSILYKNLFAGVLGNGVFYVADGKYNLNALKSYTVLSLGELSDEIKSVRVMSFTTLDISMCKRTHNGNIANALFEVMKDKDIEILSVEFEFVFATSSERFKVKIISPFKAKFQAGCDEELVERFFKNNGMSKDTSYEKIDFLAETRTLLAVL